MRVFILALGIFLCTAGSAPAHPPASIDVKYNTSAKNFIAIIDHRVSNPTKHYIRKVIIKLNGKQVAEQYFTKQSTVNEQQIIFTVGDITIGDLLEIEAFCNVGGRRSQPVRIQ
ncbi:MAG TPA: hypothetical protein PLO93_04980 [Candidatus Omnitrophota bacterium]|nr:hypothetical protein [Candidatus Omnitrophota bacterium]HQL41630.1 hypothetical protein [Candidatus Omnitrophota bacterium]